MKTSTVVVEVSGGVLQAVHGLPAGIDYIVLDWDNLLGDGADCLKEWSLFDAQMQAWIQANYPDDYVKLQERIAADIGFGTCDATMDLCIGEHDGTIPHVRGNTCGFWKAI